MKKAQSLIEYGLILALVAVIAVAATQLLGNKTSQVTKNASDAVQGAATLSAPEKMCSNVACPDGSTGQLDNGICTCKPNED